MATSGADTADAMATPSIYCHAVRMKDADKPNTVDCLEWLAEKRNAAEVHFTQSAIRIEKESIDPEEDVLNFPLSIIGRNKGGATGDKTRPIIPLDYNAQDVITTVIEYFSVVAAKQERVKMALKDLKKVVSLESGRKLNTQLRGALPSESIYRNLVEGIVDDIDKYKRDTRSAISYFTQTLQGVSSIANSGASALLDMTMKTFALSPCSKECFVQTALDAICQNQPRPLPMYTTVEKTSDSEILCVVCQDNLLDAMCTKAIKMHPKRIMNKQELRANISDRTQTKNLPSGPCTCESFSMCLECLLLDFWDRTGKGSYQCTLCPFCRGYYMLQDITRVQYREIPTLSTGGKKRPLPQEEGGESECRRSKRVRV